MVQQYTYAISLVVPFSYPFLGTGFQTTLADLGGHVGHPIAIFDGLRTHPLEPKIKHLRSVSSTTVKRGFNEIRDLRDHLAHANYYAETPEAARQVCQVGRKIRRIQADLLTGIEDQ